MSVGYAVRVDSFMSNLGIGAVIRARTNRTRFYMKVNFNHYIRIVLNEPHDFTHYRVTKGELGTLSSGAYYLIQDKKTKQKFINIIKKHGYVARQETIYVQES